jgi:hypothetical protein
VAAHVCAHHGATPKLSEDCQALFASDPMTIT